MQKYNIESFIDSVYAKLSYVETVNADTSILIENEPNVSPYEYIRSLDTRSIYRMRSLNIELRPIPIFLYDDEVDILTAIIACFSDTIDDLEIYINMASNIDKTIIERVDHIKHIFNNTQSLTFRSRGIMILHDLFIDDALSFTKYNFALQIYTSCLIIHNKNNITLNRYDIIGAMLYAYMLAINIDINSVKIEAKELELILNILSKLEPEDSPYYSDIKNIFLYARKYLEKLTYKTNKSDFYKESFYNLNSIDTYNGCYVTDPVQSISHISFFCINEDNIGYVNMIDFLRQMKLSNKIPFIYIDVNGKHYIKQYKDATIDPNWFTPIQMNSMKIILKYIEDSNKYYEIIYKLSTNDFTLTYDEKNININAIFDIFSSHCNYGIISTPKILYNTYEFYSQFICDGIQNNISGIDRSILAWIITNPPRPYNDIIKLQYYTFLKEDNKPDAWKDHLNIHIVIGNYKVYLSLSNITTNSRNIMVDEDKPCSITPNISVYRIKINTCPYAEIAYICREIYRHIINLYMTYYQNIKQYLYNTYSIERSNLNPQYVNFNLTPLIYNAKALTIDSRLFLRVNIDAHMLPVSVDKADISMYLSKGYSVMRLPTNILNAPEIKFDIKDECYIRTNNPNEVFSIIPKTNDILDPISKKKNIPYFAPIVIPALSKNIVYNISYLIVDTKTWNCKLLHKEKIETYELTKNDSIRSSMIKYGRIINIGSLPLLDGLVNNYYSGRIIPTDITYTFINILGYTNFIERIIEYAYLCLQECSDQNVEDIENDMKNGLIFLDKHWRAIQEGLNINIFILSKDSQKPFEFKNYKYVYIHGPITYNRKCIVFTQIDICTVLVGFHVNIKIVNPSEISYLLPSEINNKLCNLLKTYINVKYTNIDTNETLTIDNTSVFLGENAYAQYVDKVGKCRGIVYKYEDAYVTVDIGLKSILMYPKRIVREIVNPTFICLPNNSIIPKFLIYKYKSTPITHEELINDTKNIIYNKNEYAFDKWKSEERTSRILCIIVKLLYSIYNGTIDEFIEKHIIVTTVNDDYYKSYIPYSTYGLILSNNNYYDVLSKYIPHMIINQNIIVPDETTKYKLKSHLHACGKITLHTELNQVIVYSWDLTSSKDEIAFTDIKTAINHHITSNEVYHGNMIIPSIQPYIIQYNDTYFLIQTCVSLDHVKYIIYMWYTYRINPSMRMYKKISMDNLTEVNVDLLDIDVEFSYAIQNSIYYAIIKLY